MKVQITQVNRYEININGIMYYEFQCKDEWEGMLKFSGPAGTIIVVKPNNLQLVFSDLFCGPFDWSKANCEEFDVVRISPELSKSKK